MTQFRKTLIVTALAVAAMISPASGQEGGAKLVEFGRHTVQVQKTPQIQAQGVKDKRWTPKEWLEIEFPFRAMPIRTSPDIKMHESMQFKFYIVLSPADPKKRVMLTAEVTHVNVPIGQEVATVVYISPGTIERLTGEKANPSMVKAYGVEVTANGGPAGIVSSASNKPFWKEAAITKDFPEKSGFLLTKPETPFAPLWGDYHAEVQKK